MTGELDGRVAVVTGAGGAIGSAYARALAAAGASVVVNDLNVSVDGGSDEGSDRGNAVVTEIAASGGTAAASGHDIASWAGAAGLLDFTLDHFGRADFLINNAGILRDKTIINLTESDWDDVIRVHLKGTFCPTRHFAAHWRGLAKAGKAVDARIINTTSASGLFGKVGQSNYAAAKAGIASFTLVASAEFKQYGVAVNAIRPTAASRMTADLGDTPGDTTLTIPRDQRRPEDVAPVVVWACSPAALGVTGRIIEASTGRIGVLEGWRHGPEARTDGRWDLETVTQILPGLLASATPPEPVLGAR